MSAASTPGPRLTRIAAAATSAGSLVGLLAEVRTMRVSERYGQARVDVPGGGEVTVQVRSREENGLTAGSEALLVDYDDDEGVFWVSELSAADASVLGEGSP